jgi:membrane associated rhomboid family serine protease
MLGSWDQPRVGGARDRFSNSFRGWLHRFGSVVQLLIVINLIVFGLQLLCGLLNWPIIEPLFALSGQNLRRGMIWQPFTYMFLHDAGNLFHILINMLFLWFIGREVEYFIGPKYFTRLYFAAGLAGAALYLAFNFNSPTYVLGASAAVLGCVIAFATLFPNRDVTLLLFFVLPITLKAKYLAMIFVALDLFPVLTRAGGNIAHLAHIGGAAFGYFYIKHLGYGATPRWISGLQSIGTALKPRRRPKPRPMTREEFIRTQVDPILDKIAREGMHNLTRGERKILESAKDLMQKQ